MRKWLKIVLGLSFTTIIFLIVLGFVFYKMLHAPLPVYEGEISTREINGGIEIYRDSLAIPYILAQNEEDAAFALGYVHSQERMFSMDLIRRAGEGRLSEVLGSEMLPFDKMFLTVGIRKFAYDNFSRIDPVVRKLLVSYAAGVNYYIKNQKGKYPVEFDILGYEPYEWKPEHSLIIIRMMGWELNIAWWVDYTYAYIAARIGSKKAAEILPEYISSEPFGNQLFLDDNKIDLSFIKTDRRFRQLFGFGGTQIGSNNWAVNNSASSSGKPIIANDPHLAYSAPGRWMAAVLRGGDLRAEGVTLPGVPGIVIGKNENISWTLTNLMADDCDFYIEKIDSSGKNYLLDGKWKELQSRKVRIKVKDSLDAEYVIKYTHRGPIVSDIHPYDFLYSNREISRPVISMRWNGNDFSDEMLAFYKINIARNWEDFRDALKSYALPGQNFVYADKDGNIGYLMGSRIPLRGGTKQAVIYDGSTSAGDWKGYLPYYSQPFFLNPPENYIATANNKVVENFSQYITTLWEPDSRIKRIRELLQSKKQHSADDFKKYQLDQVSPYARELAKYITDAFRNFRVKDDNLNLALELIEKWDHKFDAASQTPAIYCMFLDHLLSNIYRDELGDDLYNEYVFVGSIPYRNILRVLADPQTSVIDNCSTDAVETRDDIIRRSLWDAVTELQIKSGSDVKNWQWGQFHKARFKHSFSGISGILDKVIDVGPFSVGGDGTTIFNTEYPFNDGIREFPRFDHEKFENDLGPSMRYIFDFASPDEFYLVLTTGQSGHVISDHYSDMTELWLKGGYIKIRTDLNSIKNPANLLLRIYRD